MADLKPIAREIFVQSLADCAIGPAFDRSVQIAEGIGGAELLTHGASAIRLGDLRHIRIIAAGKAASPMLDGLLQRLPVPQGCDLGGVLMAPQRPARLPGGIAFFRGGHPVPDEASSAGALAALAALGEIAALPSEQTLALFLISGGASAMMELPLDGSISLSDTIAFHRELVHCGANIVEMNCVRKHFSAVKGGRLAMAAGCAQKVTFAVSDVPSAHLDALGSGPTLPDPTSIAECREILARYGLRDRLPASIRHFFESQSLPETPKPGEMDSPVITLLDAEELARAAQARCAALGFHAVIDNGCDDWPYDRAADYLLGRLRELRRRHGRCCVISTGEVSVRVVRFADAATHLGGRNQHLALYMTTRLRAEDGAIAVLSAGSDGIDGNSSAAGAVVDEATAENASPGGGAGSAESALAAFDSSTWLAARNATIVTGPTGQNLRDLRILLADAAATQASGG